MTNNDKVTLTMTLDLARASLLIAILQDSIEIDPAPDASTPKKLSIVEARILAALKTRRKALTKGEIYELVGGSKRSVYRRISTLTESGRLIQVDNTYRINKES